MALLSLAVEPRSTPKSQAELHVASRSKACRPQRRLRSRDSSATRPDGSTSPARSSRTLKMSCVVVASLRAAWCCAMPCPVYCMSGTGITVYLRAASVPSHRQFMPPSVADIRLSVEVIKEDTAGLLCCCQCRLRLCRYLSDMLAWHVCKAIGIALPPCAWCAPRYSCFSRWCELRSQGARRDYRRPADSGRRNVATRGPCDLSCAWRC